MYLFCISFAIYGLGCALTMIFFMVGRSPALDERGSHWPIIFLWPLLIFWPIHALAGYFIKRTTNRPKTPRQTPASENKKRIEQLPSDLKAFRFNDFSI